MASGDVLYDTGTTKAVLLLDAAAAATDGVWVSTDSYVSGIVVVLLTAGSMSITVQGLNNLARPAAATDGVGLAAALTASGQVTISTLPAWIKADGTITTGPVTAIAVLRR